MGQDGHAMVATKVTDRFTDKFTDNWWAPGLASLAIAVVLVALGLVRSGGDVSILVHAAPPWTDPALARDSLTVQEPDQGFDGQFFYRLGVSPWSSDETVAGVTNDLPALRNARWGYGALAWVLSAANPDLVPVALVVINLGAAFALGVAGGALARSAGRRRIWGTLFILWPGFAYSLTMDTSELMASALLLWTLVVARQRKWGLASLLLSAAVITRDTTAVVVFGFVASGLWLTLRKQRWHPSLVTGLIPAAVFGGWQLIQYQRFGELPFSSSSGSNLSSPLGGLVELWSTTALPTTSAEALRLISSILVIGLIGATGYFGRGSSATIAEKAAWCGAVAVVVVLNAYLWSGATAFMRASTEAGVLSIVILLGVKGRRVEQVLGQVLGASLGVAWMATAAAQLAKLG